MVEKPKTSTIEIMSQTDLALVDRLVVLCKSFYYKTSHPSKPGPHTSLNELDELRSELLRMSLRVGERAWFPRGETNGKRKDRLKSKSKSG
jgi:hypothetical protein